MSERHCEKPLVLSAGEPAGIGPDLCLGLAGNLSSAQPPVVVIADPEQLQIRARALALDVKLTHYEPGTPVAARSHVFLVAFARHVALSVAVGRLARARNHGLRFRHLIGSRRQDLDVYVGKTIHLLSQRPL